MFKERHIYFIKSFQFNNGGESKDKYFIVLKTSDKNVIIGTLPTRANKIPSFVTIEHGCINIDERMYNCYLFKKNQTVCKNGFCFDMPTFIYGTDIDSYLVAKMANDYPKEGENYVTIGVLNDLEYENIMKCLQNSKAIKKSIQRKLE